MLTNPKARPPTRLRWDLMMASNPACHLVVGALEMRVTAEGNPLGQREAQTLAARVIGSQGPTGRYAVSLVRPVSGPEVHCAFELEEDAVLFAGLVDAVPSCRPSEWASFRVFRFHSEDQARMLALAPPWPASRRGRRRT